jgi:hypothetical protein
VRPDRERHGAVPRHETAHWTSSGVDGYRINARFGANESDAPDLVPIGITASLEACPEELTVRVDITNQGAAAVAAGTPVSLYERTSAGALVLLGVVELESALPPGGVARVTLTVPFLSAGSDTLRGVYVIVDDDGTGIGRARECNEANNTSMRIDVECIEVI